MNIELPKWPLLLVTGKRITPEQTDKVIVRTTWLRGMHCNEDWWNKRVIACFGVKALTPPPLRRRDYTLRWTRDAVPYEEWERVGRELGVLDVQYLNNARIASINLDGPYGWVDWDGTVGTDGMAVTNKWPEVGEVHDEWAAIARAFPFLDLTAQLVEMSWDHDRDDYGPPVPLVTWTVMEGAVQMHDEPGPLLRELGEEKPVRVGMGSEAGTTEKRLRQAVQRCRRDMERRRR